MTAFQALRSVLFTLIMIAWGLIAGVVFLPILLMSRRTVRIWGGWWSQSVIALARYICGIRWQVRGLENLPKDGRVIFASKHQSAWDTLFFPFYFPGVASVAKRELKLIPLYGWYTWRAGTIWINRAAGPSAIRTLVRGTQEALAGGRHVVIFPQGTRTSPGETRPYQSGIAAIYAAAKVPVVPVALNSGLCWGRRALFKTPGLITVELLPPIPPGLDRKTFMTTLEAALEPATVRLEAEERARRDA
jgi:1-acyl-sn-glycerol-3-phosphate acyltransferase